MQGLKAWGCLYCLQRQAGGSVLAAILAMAAFSVAEEKAIGEVFKGEDIWRSVLRRATNF